MAKSLSTYFPRSSYIVSPLYDWIAFIGAPLIAFIFAMLIYYRLIPNPKISIGPNSIELWIFIFLYALTQSHLFITGIRAYGNKKIFSQFKTKLIIGPLIIFLAMYISEWIFMIMVFVITWWDVYHSACQTYGFTRLYDIRIGNKSLSMQIQDRILNCLIYIGPIIGGASLIPHLQDLRHDFFRTIFLGDIPYYANVYSKNILIIVLIFSSLFLPYYIYCYWKESKEQPISYQKISILLITTIVSILAWGFNSFGMAFFIANFFHAWQYYAMIYWSEKPALSKRFNINDKQARYAIIGLLIGCSLFFILCRIIFNSDIQGIASCLFLTVSACHFWFDGFIWSVKKKHI